MLGGVGDPFTTFYNPAANSTHPGLQASLGVDFAHPSFNGISNIVVNNSAISNAQTPQFGAVDTKNYLDHLGQMVGLSLNLGENFKFLALGATAFLPIARVAYLDTGDPFLPEYVSYRSRTQRPQIYLSGSASPFSHLHLASGIAIATNLSATANVFLTTSSSGISHQEIASTIKPGAAPYFSLYADPDPLQLGMTIRLPNRYKVSMDVNATASILGQLNGLPLLVNASSSMYYDPLEIDLAFASTYANGLLWSTVEADWLQYKAFETPILTVTNMGSGANIRNSIDTTPTMNNIVILKTGTEVRFEKTRFRVGYMYRPSPVSDNSGSGNMIDPDRHSATLGLGVDLKKIHLTEKDISLDLNTQVHYLVKKHVTKTAGNELGNLGESKIGSPGYDIGGFIYGAGFSLSMAF